MNKQYIKRPQPDKSIVTRVKDAQKLIIVEGSDDAYFFEKILEKMNFCDKEYGIVVVGGTSNFKSVLSNVSKENSFIQNEIKSILIVQDADKSAEVAEKSLQKITKEIFGVTPKNKKFEKSKDGINIGIFILAHDEKVGALEDLCLEVVKNDNNYQFLEDYMKNTCAGNKNKEENKKRWLQAFLAVQSDPLCNGAGKAIKDDVFDINHQIFTPVCEMVKLLNSLE